ncbi:MAG: shikimate dehydrogenase [Candidatus Omnitrophica bacterium]|nr:shikimate dehydrogenase [Candidatus Omnitrophota bacterium]
MNSLKTFGLVGYPVKHSLSPAMHNAAFKFLNINAQYKLFELRPEELGPFFCTFEEDYIYGVNVTIPYKESVIPLMGKLTEEASLIGAVNTVKIEDEKLVGHNTDGNGFIQDLLGFFPRGISGIKVSIIGAGGAAKAVGISLAKHGAQNIIFYDIDRNRAQGLADKISLELKLCPAEAVDSIEGLFRGKTDLLINASNSGMKETDPVLVSKESLAKVTFVYDLIYNPAKTKLLQLAERSGVKFANGLGMLLHQGALAFEFWTGKAAPLDQMRNALKEAV